MRTGIFSLVCLLLAGHQLMGQHRIDLYPSVKGLRIGGRDSIQDAPHLLHFPIDGTQKPAVLICPGGAYTMLANRHEGTEVAEFFNRNGYEAFVLMYRLNDHEQRGSRYPAQWEDVTRAMQIIKSGAAGFGIDPEKTGILGFSAGGHLASMGSTLFVEADKSNTDPVRTVSSRPAFSILIYPVISLSDSFAHSYSGEMLLGRNASMKMKDSLSTYKRVRAGTPPAFIVFSADDEAVPPANGIKYYEALRHYRIKASLHIFDHGGHGYGMAKNDPVLSEWPVMAIAWLKQLGITGIN